MRRRALWLLPTALAACVSVEPAIDPKGAVRPGQRVIVLTFQSPGPWIVHESDSKAEAAAKISPLGFLVQTVQEDRILAVSKDLQQYLPRPPYALRVQTALIEALRGLHDGPIDSYKEGGLPPVMMTDWNRAKDQLDWRRRYYSVDQFSPVPRDYSRVLTLDDAVVLDVNVSFGTEVTPVENEADLLHPAISASVRAYRGGTTKLLWSREETLTDKVSTRTLSEFKIDPVELTNRIVALAPALGQAVAAQFAKSFALTPPAIAAPPVPAEQIPPAPGKGLLDLGVEVSSPPATSSPTAPSP